MKPELYISTDIEADGPIPGSHSMLTLASAAYMADKTLIDTFTVNLEELPEAKPHTETKEWWLQHPEAWAICRQNCQPPKEAMQSYFDWLKNLPGKPVFVGYPAAYDFMFVYWYLIKFVGSSPFSHSALDIKTLAMVKLGTTYRETSKRRMPPEWFDNLSHTHVALDDAIEQGALFCNILAELKQQTNQNHSRKT